VRLYWPSSLRPAFDALFGIDDALADVVASSTQPALGAIRLAWWRDALERLDHGPAPAEPRLRSAAAGLLPLGVTGRQLSLLEGGWAALLDEQPEDRLALERGEALFAIGARLLGEADPAVAAAGRLFAWADLRRRGHGTDIGSQLRPYGFARRLRPLTALAALAARDLRLAPRIEEEATPGRALALLRHRFSGVVALPY
jgi:phytoene synthase